MLALYYKLLFVCLFIYERDRESESDGGAERERENPKQALHSECRAQYGARTQNQGIMT